MAASAVESAVGAGVSYHSDRARECQNRVAAFTAHDWLGWWLVDNPGHTFKEWPKDRYRNEWYVEVTRRASGVMRDFDAPIAHGWGETKERGIVRLVMNLMMKDVK